ncbi:hypothetical protein N7495_002287 [Penicillium taxi]|uniref:uncharacterized protein n=1 Tax=Penicillium taxi TaxID=168475 RepID=UPI002544E2FD|nr:uncharacterized protein N7495_002287 [Penicillium taxi]KAJ5901759.1 hypothetical protein N7495_002287 [Penicillium taxi]
MKRLILPLITFGDSILTRHSSVRELITSEICDFCDFWNIDFWDIDFWDIDFWDIDFWDIDFWDIDFWDICNF